MGWDRGSRQWDMLGAQRTSASATKCCAVPHSWLLTEFMIAHAYCCLCGQTSSFDCVYILQCWKVSVTTVGRVDRLLSRARRMGVGGLLCNG